MYICRHEYSAAELNTLLDEKIAENRDLKKEALKLKETIQKSGGRIEHLQQKRKSDELLQESERIKLSMQKDLLAEYEDDLAFWQDETDMAQQNQIALIKSLLEDEKQTGNI